MKRKCNFIEVLLSLVLVTFLLAGCVGKEQEPDVTAKAYYDLFILGDSTEIEKMGIPKDDIDELMKKQKEGMSTALTSELSSAGFNLTDDKVQELTNALIGSISKLTATTEVESKDNDKATVKISSNHIDLMNICTDAANSVLPEVQGLGITDTNELQNKFISMYIDKVIESLGAVKPSDDVIENSFDFKLTTVESDGKKINAWVADDMYNFGLEIGEMAMGIKEK